MSSTNSSHNGTHRDASGPNGSPVHHQQHHPVQAPITQEPAQSLGAGNPPSGGAEQHLDASGDVVTDYQSTAGQSASGQPGSAEPGGAQAGGNQPTPGQAQVAQYQGAGVAASSAEVTTALNGLLDVSPGRRGRAALIVGSYADARLTQRVLVAYLEEQDSGVRESLAWAAARTPQATIECVQDIINNPPSTQVLARVLYVLGLCAQPTNIDALIRFATTDHLEVSREARWALSRMQNPATLGALIDLLGIQEVAQRNALSQNIANFGGNAVSWLTEALQNSDPRVAQHAADVLCLIGGPDIEPAVAALCDTALSADEHLAISSLMALGDVGTDEARAGIQAVKDRTPDKNHNARVEAVARELLEPSVFDLPPAPTSLMGL